MERFAAALRFGAHEQVVALVQKLRERMAGIDRQRREHRKNFFLEITARPGCAFRVQLRDVMDTDSVLGQSRRELVIPERILRCDQFVRDALNRVEGLGRAQAIRATSLVSLSICCLMPATRISKNSSRFELKMVRNFTRSMSGCVGSCASSKTRRLNSSQLSSRLMKFSGAENRLSGVALRQSDNVCRLFGGR